ncbi:hypothetical protein [Geodermatophilus africanus]|uniref:hypothetical protein n=1 Tax=Geodermatophilus africanus TaxID=1137993 RepID=UPI0011146EF1|nr:hypothetical protein [Geodermatophilus africanus]
MLVTATRSQSAMDDGPGLNFGVLGSTCDPDRVAALRASGVRYAEVELTWGAFEPAPGRYDRVYQDRVRQMLDTCAQAGLSVVLTLGLHAAPPWVGELAAGTYRDQAGGLGPADVPNVVFSAAVRDAVRGYLAELDRVVLLNSVAAIRVGTGYNGELGYPTESTSPATARPFWAFDEAAQTGAGLAEDVSVSPMPGWTPGSPTWNGRDVRPEDVRTWFRWYSQSVADAVIWLAQTLRDQGFERDIHLPLAGRGALPRDLTAAVAARLDGRTMATDDGSLEAGLYYPEQLHHIAQRLAQSQSPRQGAVLADTASVDDATAVTARRRSPAEDSCRPEDSDRDLESDPEVVRWSSFRWTIANARSAGLDVIGENPGSPDTPRTGGNALTDSLAEQMLQAPQYARDCGLSLLMWAFEDDLCSAPATLGMFATQIRAVKDDPSGISVEESCA